MIPNGFRYSLGQDRTELTFQPTTSGTGPFQLSAVATIETWFARGMPDFDPFGLARLNRRAAYGNFYRADDGVRSKLTFSIYEKEPAADWVAEILLTAFGAQCAFGIGTGQSELSDELLRANRANLEYPRQWTRSVMPEQFEASAERFRSAGLFSTSGQYGFTLEVPLTDGAQSRMIDPTAETALLRVSTDVSHPTAGVGFLGTIALPYDPRPEEIVQWCEYLNAREHEQEDFVPRLGAWGMRGMNNQIVYSLFWPTAQGDATIHQTIMNWLVQRTLWVRDNFWLAGYGLDRLAENNNG
jgi:hypothetical protein